MSEILLQIDGKDVAAQEGMTILEAAQSVGVSIPTLCLHEKLDPYGACRICSVEVESRGRTNVVAACLYPVEQDLVVTTRSEKLDRIRKSLLEMMMAHAPDSPQLTELATTLEDAAKAKDPELAKLTLNQLCSLSEAIEAGQYARNTVEPG